MNVKVFALLGTMLLVALIVLTAVAAPPAEAKCLAAGDLYCPPWWTPTMRKQQVRLETMDQVLADPYYAGHVARCDDTTPRPEYGGKTCIANYDTASGGVLYAFADKNGLPRAKTVMFAIVVNDLWGRQNKASFNGDAKHDGIVWAKHFYWGFVDLATRLDVNPPLQIVGRDETEWCLKQEYGGVCPGKWR